MKVHLKQIPTDGLHLEGDEECPIPELETEGIRCVGPLHYNVDLGVAGGALWASGSLSQPVELHCVSCLEKFVHEIQVPAFAVHTELTGPEAVDLTSFMREDLLLNLPARSEEHTSELQSPCNLVCRLLLEKKKQKKIRAYNTPTNTISKYK